MWNLTRRRTQRGLLVALVLALLCVQVGCQNRRAGATWSNPFAVQRVPAPATGSLVIPGVSPLAAPPSQLPPMSSGSMGYPGMAPTGMSAPGMSAPGVIYPGGVPMTNPGGGVTPGVYFPTSTPTSQTPTSGTIAPAGPSPWHTTQNTGFNGGPTYTAIPDRPPSATPASFTTAASINPNQVPNLLQSGFDPYSTANIPTWQSSSGPGYNPLVTTNQPMGGPGSEVGFWSGQLNGTGGASSSADSGFGWRLRKWFGGGRFQPANVTGFATTAPVDNPMIPVPIPGATNSSVAGFSPAGASMGASATSAGAALPGNNLSYSRWLDNQRALAAQQQQWAAWQQAQYRNQQVAMAQAAALAAGPGAGSYQVLAEASTSRTAENQRRMGWTGPPVSGAGNSYSAANQGPVMNPAMAAPQVPPMFQTAGQPLGPSSSSGQRSAWQAGGVR